MMLTIRCYLLIHLQASYYDWTHVKLNPFPYFVHLLLPITAIHNSLLHSYISWLL